MPDVNAFRPPPLAGLLARSTDAAAAAERRVDVSDRDDETFIEDEEQWEETVVNDAVAGETILPGRGEGNAGPTGGAAREQEPLYAENDLADEEIDLADEPD
jgi:hypothetical protein